MKNWMTLSARTLMTLSVVGTLAALPFAAVPLAAQAEEDPNLAQSVNADETISTDTVAIARGHVDVGPRIFNDEWTVMARHDAETGPTWYDADNVVIQVVDSAQLPAPEGEDYAFMSEAKTWYVIPQTENPAVTWLGWNTQDPQVTHQVKRGVTMTVGPLDGPGRSVLFLQDGTFGKPRVLMDSAVEGAHDIWVDVNTHVHANWAFSAPGIYRAAVTFTAETTDGRTLTESATLRFAVGDTTDPAAALELPALEPVVPQDKGSATSLSGEAEGQESATDESPLRTWLMPFIIGTVVAIGAGVMLARSTRSRREAAQALAERDSARTLEVNRAEQMRDSQHDTNDKERND